MTILSGENALSLTANYTPPMKLSRYRCQWVIVCDAMGPLRVERHASTPLSPSPTVVRWRASSMVEWLWRCRTGLGTEALLGCRLLVNSSAKSKIFDTKTEINLSKRLQRENEEITAPLETSYYFYTHIIQMYKCIYTVHTVGLRYDVYLSGL